MVCRRYGEPIATLPGTVLIALFDCFVGFWEFKGSGDIESPEEINWFIRHVRKMTFRQGVHVAVASGVSSS